MGHRLLGVLMALTLGAGCAGPRLQTAEPTRMADAASGIVQVDTLGRAPAASHMTMLSGSDSDDWPEPAPCPPAPPLPPSPASVAPAVALDETPEAPTETPPVEDAAPAPADVMDDVAPPPPAETEAPSLALSDADAAACCPPCWGNKRCGGYGGFSLAAWPGLGASMHFGINYYMDERVLWSYDFSFLYQDMTDDFMGGEDLSRGKYTMFRAGLRARFNPCCSRWHPTLRFGLAWASITGSPDQIDSSEAFADFPVPGDYFGVHVGVGIEYDINHRWSTGPEISMLNAYNFGREEYAYSFTLWWHLTYKF